MVVHPQDEPTWTWDEEEEEEERRRKWANSVPIKIRPPEEVWEEIKTRVGTVTYLCDPEEDPKNESADTPTKQEQNQDLDWWADLKMELDEQPQDNAQPLENLNSTMLPSISHVVMKQWIARLV